MSKALKATVRAMCDQIENINKEIEIVKQNQIKIPELKSTTENKKNKTKTNRKNLTIDTQIKWAEEKISKLQHVSTELCSELEQK